jgi:hypothetical protein
MPQIWLPDSDGRNALPVTDGRPFPTKILGTALAAGPTVRTDRIRVPGIGTASAYADGDAFGTRFTLAVPFDGIIGTVVFFDLDDEGIQKDIVLFDAEFTETADNSAFAVTDADLIRCVGVISVNAFYNFNANQIGVSTPALAYTAPEARLWGQIVTRGADNIAASNIPEFYMVVAQ